MPTHPSWLLAVVPALPCAARGADSNVLTQPASQVRGVHARLTEGSHGISDRVLRLGADFERLDVRLSLNQTEVDGLDRLVDHNRHRFANLRADLRPTGAPSRP